jgi:hypothetical protein
MSDLRLRIELNKGGEGISFPKLAEISLEAAKFLRMIVSDVDRTIAGTWIAQEFENSSVDFTARFSGNITREQVGLCHNALDATMKEEFDFALLEQHRVRRATLLQYTKIAKAIAPDEAIHFRLYDGNGDNAIPHILTKDHSLELVQKLRLTDTVSYYGSIQGVMTALFKDPSEYAKPHFRLRELYSGILLPCFYTSDQYDMVLSGLHNKDAVVHIAGTILASRTERKPLELKVSKIMVAEQYQEGDLERFIGCAPEVTGDQTTEEYIDSVRGRDVIDKSQEIT